MSAAAGRSLCGISGLNDSGRKGEISGLTSIIHLPETSVNWRAEDSLESMVAFNSSNPSEIWKFLNDRSDASSSTDIDLPDPKRIASSKVERFVPSLIGSHSLDLSGVELSSQL